MPTYDYLCTECGREFEIMHSIKDEPRTECEACGEPALKRQLGAGAGIIFKGSGFYETDYKRASKPKRKTSGTKKEKKKGKSGDSSSK